MFSVDYPFSDSKASKQWFDALPINDTVRENISHKTALSLLKI
jgi:predicted TIM-barrel fold metal-dependent hydrolase